MSALISNRLPPASPPVAKVGLRRPFTVLGRRLYHPILRHTDSDHPGGSGTGRFRPDQLTAGVFAIVDLTDPARPATVVSTNLIGTIEYPSDVYWDTWLADPKLPKVLRVRQDVQ